jgi:hypothetical protein
MDATSTYPALYQATSAAFVGLLVAVVINEVRAHDKATPHDLVAATSLAIFAITLGGGEIAALTALFIGHGTKALRDIVWIGATLATIMAVARGMVVAADRLLEEEAVRRWASRGAVVAMTATATLAVVYIISRPEKARPPGADVFRVYGTCVAGSCGLNQRPTPSRTAQSLGVLYDGDPVRVVCQLRGTMVRASPGHSSNLWDLLDDGSFVSDLFVSTSKSGARSANVTPCPPGQTSNTPHG